MSLVGCEVAFDFQQPLFPTHSLVQRAVVATSLAILNGEIFQMKLCPPGTHYLVMPPCVEGRRV